MFYIFDIDAKKKYFLFSIPKNKEDGCPFDGTEVPPVFEDGKHPYWTGKKWEQEENHKGKCGYLGGEPYIINEYGPPPEGFSETPPLPSLEEAIQLTVTEIMVRYSAAFAPVDAAYPANEREGWTIQLEEARAVLEDENAETPTLTALVKERAMGEAVQDFAAIVMANNAMYRTVYAKLTGQQQRMYRDVMSMAAMEGVTAAQVLAYPVQYEMPEGF